MSLEDLGRRAVACKHWRWLDGMQTTCFLRVIEGSDGFVIGHRHGVTRDRGGWYDGDADGLLPDLSDAATIGCMLVLVREAWTCDPEVNHWVSYAVPVFDGLETWRVGCILDGAKMFAVCNLATMALVEGKTEAEALVAALEAAP